MSIDLGDIPIGTPPTSGEKSQIRDILGVATKASPTFTGTVAIPNVANLETAVVANTAKLTNVSTNLSVTANGTSLTVESSDGNNVALPAATTSAWGVMSDDQATKLDGIEASADVTDATNVTAAGALMDSECSNLAAVKAFTGEAGATADQTNAEIRTAVEAASDSNVFTDADHTKLNAISGTNTGDEATATESAEGIVELATSTEVESGWSSAAEKIVRSSHLRLKVEGGGIVLKGTTDPTSGGANTGVDSIISGSSNYGNSGYYSAIFGRSNYNNTGSYCLIAGGGTTMDGNRSNSGDGCIIGGEDNHTNSGDYCIIGGSDNWNNSGDSCIIGGEDNRYNSGDACIIGGEDNEYNSGDTCSITGEDNHNNSGENCSISGQNNQGNFGTHSTIGGKVASGSTKIATSGTSAEADDNLITKSSHGLTLNQPLRFTTLTGGAGLSTSTLYYVRTVTTNSFAVSLTVGGAEVDVTTDYTVANYIGNAVNYGNFSTIAGGDNEGNSGSWCSISGNNNHSNSGSYCQISGGYNHTNTGTHCSISGSDNNNNSGNYCSISGYGSIGGLNNSGNHCQISGHGNTYNSGDKCIIGGQGNSSNSGTHCAIFGELNSKTGTDKQEGNHCLISGKNNFNNSGGYSSISGEYNYSNSGTHCSISGRLNSTNSGTHCQISGTNNASNSGNYCQISGQSNSTNSGTHCQISGKSNFSNSGTHCSISGEYNYSNSGTHCSISGRLNSTNSGDYCSISGNNNASNTGHYCSISGRSASSNALDYARVHGGSSNARLIDLVAQINSVSTTATELLLGGTGGSRIVIPDQSAWACEIHFVAKTDTGANASMQRVHGLLVRDGTSTTWGAGVAETQVDIGTSNATFTVSADDTNEALKLEVTCSSGTVKAVATLRLTQVDY